MLFCSSEFLIFFAVVFAVYWATPWARPRVWLLLAASFYFYACWNQWLALIVLASATFDYLLGHAIDRARGDRLRRALVAVSVVANLGLLCYFKYANFFLDSLGQALRSAGVRADMPLLSVIVPIGISFYTFEAINYVVDVYCRRVRPERNLGNFLLFILFFPHLVAGPIVRARDFLPQIRRKKRWSWARADAGVRLFLLGLVKKLVLADRMALFADPVFADPAGHTSAAAWVALFAYAVQIYGDFSGYSDMALGSAHLLGYHLAPNFDMPYLARNVSEFWRRWHISLSTWLRDYLFIPLGGSRGGRWLVARNLMITMTLGGLWHGANWNFVLWGVAHGLLLVLHRLWQDVCRPRPWLSGALATPPGTALRGATTLLCVCLCWVLFRAQTLAQAGAFFGRLAADGGTKGVPMPVAGFWLLIGLLALGHLAGRLRLWERLGERLPTAAVGASYAVSLSVALALSPASGKTFIYFQF